MKLAEIISVARKANIKSAGAYSLRLSGIGACVLAPVTLPYPESVFAVKSKYICGKYHQQSRETGWNVVQHIIKLCGSAPEVYVFVICVAKHGIHCVCRLVEKSAHSAPKRHIEHGSGNSVGGVFRHGLHSRTDNSVTVKAFCVTADYHRNRLTCLFRVIFRKSVMDFHALVPEAACRHKIIAHNALDSNAKYQVYFIADHQQRQRYTR